AGERGRRRLTVKRAARMPSRKSDRVALSVSGRTDKRRAFLISPVARSTRFNDRIKVDLIADSLDPNRVRRTGRCEGSKSGNDNGKAERWPASTLAKHMEQWNGPLFGKRVAERRDGRGRLAPCQDERFCR